MNTVNSVRMLQAVSVVVAVAVVMVGIVIPAITPNAFADNITTASDTITNSAPSASANHEIVFTLPNGAVATQTFEVTFDANFTNLGSIIEDDVDLDVAGTPATTAATNGAGQWGIGISGQTITFTAPTDGGVASSTELTIRIGTNAVDSGTGANQITNPSATSSYPIDIGKGASTIQDSGQVRVAIIDEVTVTASVDTSLTFTVQGTTTGISVNGSATNTQAVTTATTLPFGTLDVASSSVIAQDLFVATNAANGYTVTVNVSGDLQTPLGQTIDGFVDGSDTNTPVAWTSPSGLIGSPDTYGHWGVTSSDGAVSARTSQFTADTWVAPSTSPIAVMGHTGPSDGAQAGTGYATVGYQAEITALQEAGEDYSTTLRYIATPVF